MSGSLLLAAGIADAALSAVPVAVFAGSHAVGLTKCLCEMAEIVEARFVGDVGEGFVGLFKQTTDGCDTDLGDVFSGGDAKCFLEEAW